MRLCKNCDKPLPKGVHHNTKHCSKACKNNYYYKGKKKREPEKFFFWRAKKRAEERGWDFTIELSDIKIPKTCPVLGIPLKCKEYIKGESGADYGSPSLDRIDPKKGYIKGNVRVISNRANILKSNATKDEIRSILDDLIRLEEQGFSV